MATPKKTVNETGGQTLTMKAQLEDLTAKLGKRAEATDAKAQEAALIKSLTSSLHIMSPAGVREANWSRVVRLYDDSTKIIASGKATTAADRTLVHGYLMECEHRSATAYAMAVTEEAKAGAIKIKFVAQCLVTRLSTGIINDDANNDNISPETKAMQRAMYLNRYGESIDNLLDFLASIRFTIEGTKEKPAIMREMDKHLTQVIETFQTIASPGDSTPLYNSRLKAETLLKVSPDFVKLSCVRMLCTGAAMEYLAEGKKFLAKFCPLLLKASTEAELVNAHVPHKEEDESATSDTPDAPKRPKMSPALRQAEGILIISMDLAQNVAYTQHYTNLVWQLINGLTLFPDPSDNTEEDAKHATFITALHKKLKAVSENLELVQAVLLTTKYSHDFIETLALKVANSVKNSTELDYVPAKANHFEMVTNPIDFLEIHHNGAERLNASAAKIALAEHPEDLHSEEVRCLAFVNIVGLRLILKTAVDDDVYEQAVAHFSKIKDREHWMSLFDNLRPIFELIKEHFAKHPPVTDEKTEEAPVSKK